MNIYSWNVWYRNQTPDKAFAYIRDLDFDVLCLQEVSADFLKRLKTLPFYLVFDTDITFFSDKRSRTIYTVILSRHPIQKSGKVAFPEPKSTLRAAVSFKVRGWWKGLRDRGAVYADIDFPNGKVRIFSMHLTLSSPSARMRELTLIRSSLPKDFPVVLAGDLNIIEHALVKPLSWFLGAPIRESTPWHRERARVETQFKELRLKNPLRRKVTHGFSQSQLDHVLVPEEWEVVDARVSRKKYGSDHRPVFVAVHD
ncbi:MAG: endonuclease/exonuclease/phosphatase family protein [Patescibacteria group bacterium]|nr:endonuclease/exonuclease/phosphatase family protein [Patescibacteria group bacterium]